MKEYRMSQPKLFEKLIQVFGSISAISGKKILVIRDLEVALMLSVRNAVVYITDDEECSEAFRRNTEAGMGNDDVVLFINKWTNKLKFTKVFEKMGKFDVAIMNPPYDRNLHLKILEAVIPHAEKVVNISPVRWLQDPFAPYSTCSDYCKFEDSISKKIESLEVIPAKDASQLFDALFSMNLGIYVCGNGGYNYKHTDVLVNKIVEKTLQNNWMPYNQKDFYKSGCIQKKPYMLNVSGIRTGDTDTTRVVCKIYDNQCNVKLTNKKSAFTGGVGVSSTHFEFDTEAERYNFWKCYNHPFMLWTYRLWKIDQNIKAWKVPYFDYYDHAWDYEDFFNWFGLTSEERVRVMNEIAQMQAEKAA